MSSPVPLFRRGYASCRWLAQYRWSASAGGRRPVRCMSRSLLYQWTQSLVIFSTSPSVASGPSRNGDPSRAHSDL